MKKSITLNANNIINIRKSLDAEIIKYWKTIRNENVMSNKEIKAGMGSGKDLKALYNTILQLTKKRIMIKGMLMYLNMGITTFDYEEFKKTNNYSIFAACEAKEAIAQLKLIPYINPTEKAKKGKKGLSKKESMSSAFIASKIHDHQLEANKYDAAMEKFNSSTSINTANTSSEFEIYLAA
jgi:hypothetical protein